MNTTPGDAQFLRILVESSRAKHGLEIGVATGYGAIVMGLGFERNGGHLTSVNIDGEMQDFLDAVQNDTNYQAVIIRASDEKDDGRAVIYKGK